LAHLASYAKPKNALFGSTSPYVPLKVNVNSKGIFVISDGATKGVIQLDLNGNFVGYVGANKTAKSFTSWLQNLFYSAAQKTSLLKAAPAFAQQLGFLLQRASLHRDDGRCLEFAQETQYPRQRRDDAFL
jgi:hypothetical protein